MTYGGPIGAFGIAVTLGLFCFELFGIKKCTQLINDGAEIEKIISIQAEDDKEKKLGQIDRRPDGVLGFINEPFAAGIICPSVLATWTYIALFDDINTVNIKAVVDNYDSIIGLLSCGSLDILILDMRMPESRQMLTSITEQYSDIKIIVIAVPEDEKDYLACIESGISGYLPKESL